jgi:hypothetical protein
VERAVRVRVLIEVYGGGAAVALVAYLAWRFVSMIVATRRCARWLRLPRACIHCGHPLGADFREPCPGDLGTHWFAVVPPAEGRQANWPWMRITTRVSGGCSLEGDIYAWHLEPDGTIFTLMAYHDGSRIISYSCADFELQERVGDEWIVRV